MGDQLEKFWSIPTPQKVALFVLLMGLIAGGWYYLFYSDTTEALEKERAMSARLAKDLLAEQEKEKNLEILKQEVAELEHARDELHQRLPDDAKIAELLQQVHDQAKIAGLEMEKFERVNPEDAEMYTRIPVRMELLGTFNEITSFFYYLGKMKRIVNVENITLQSYNKNDDQSANRLRATCLATTFMSRFGQPADQKGNKR
jgi:type IV pilus assembly protein PilO